MNTLVEAVNFGALSTYEEAEDGYYIVKFFLAHTQFKIKLSFMENSIIW